MTRTHEFEVIRVGALREMLLNASADFAVLEPAESRSSDPEYYHLLEPMVQGRADAVFVGGKPKAFRVSLVKTIPLRSRGAGVESELALKLRQRGASIYDAGPGPKRLSLQNIVTYARFGFRRDVYLDNGARILDALVRTPRFNRWMASVVSPYLGESVLEIGAGIGNLTMQLSPLAARYTATDFDKEHLARLRTRLKDRPSIDIRAVNLEDGEYFRKLGPVFDSVVCLNVLEHVENDVEGLRNMQSVLREGGTAVVLVPQDPTIYGSLDTVLGHHRRYTKAELRSKMEQAGFDVSDIFDFNRITRPGWVLNGRVLKRDSFGRFQLWLFDRLVWLARRIDPMLPWPSISVVAIGVKR